MPIYYFNEVNAIFVQAAPDQVFRAIKEVPPADVPLFRSLLWIRTLPMRLTIRGGLRFANTRPLLEQLLGAGFTLLAEEANRELVVGRVGQFWKLWGGSSPQFSELEEFLTFDLANYAKVATNFYLDPRYRRSCVKLSTETRIYATDSISRKKFATYWRVIYPGSALSRRELLKAIKRRAERALMISPYDY